jgi:hypothetical protein
MMRRSELPAAPVSRFTYHRHRPRRVSDSSVTLPHKI